MTGQPNRGEIVALLERLGGDDDAEVLEAARALHAMVNAAGTGWDELLAPEDAGEAGTAETGDKRPTATGAPTGGGRDAEALALIDKLLSRPGITEEFRREMEGYRSDIADGAFADDDHRYLIALDDRLSGKA